jgi:hypothetical protein
VAGYYAWRRADILTCYSTPLFPPHSVLSTLYFCTTVCRNKEAFSNKKKGHQRLLLIVFFRVRFTFRHSPTESVEVLLNGWERRGRCWMPFQTFLSPSPFGVSDREPLGADDVIAAQARTTCVTSIFSRCPQLERFAAAMDAIPGVERKALGFGQAINTINRWWPFRTFSWVVDSPHRYEHGNRTGPTFLKLLLSATHLVYLELCHISNSGYTSPKEMLTCLSEMPGLAKLKLEFDIPRSTPPDRAGQPLPPPTWSSSPPLPS